MAIIEEGSYIFAFFTNKYAFVASVFTWFIVLSRLIELRY